MSMTSSTTTHRKRRGASRRTNGREHRQMTAEEARAFEAYSASSMAQIMTAIEARAAEGIHPDCACESYDDVFTFARWKAQGMSVKKGEKALRISSFIKPGARDADDDPAPRAETSEGDTPAPRGRMIPWTLVLFCRCQVAATETKGGE